MSTGFESRGLNIHILTVLDGFGMDLDLFGWIWVEVDGSRRIWMDFE
jgi:hypothetical protein